MSTYSNNLRIELITTGTQAGTWGDTTNTNLGTVVEDSIAGYVTVSVIAANQAFTAVDGAADQARNAMIRLTTTTGANFAVYAPPASKLYVIYNDSSYVATIYNSTVVGNTTAAGTGVAIPAGKIVTVWSNGTDFLFQNNHLDSLTLANALPVSSGGTGATTSTGSGAVVLATSPALAGTPTSTTASPGTNTTQIATTAFVQAAVTSASPFASGTAIVFAQSAAPTGWTKSTTHNDKALRVVSGAASSGGTSPFSTVFANQTPTISVGSLTVGATTLSTAEIPSHFHTNGGAGGGGNTSNNCGGLITYSPSNTGSTGGGGSHTHSISGSPTSTAITLNVQYVDVIIATKD